MVILYPGFPVSTRWVYRNLKLTKAIENTSINLSLGNFKGLKHLLVNDLERVTIGRYPRIAFLKERLVQEGAAAALMAGSGSSVFGIFSTAEKAKKAFRRLCNEEGIQVYLVRSLS
jgi:4-diphosphocytidyl-2-C-methyl-D-erythritol kinase